MLALSVYQTNTASTGMREMGRVLQKSAATVKRRIDELISAGHIQRAPVKAGQRAWYVLTSPVFGQKQRVKTEVVSCPRGYRRMVSEEIA